MDETGIVMAKGVVFGVVKRAKSTLPVLPRFTACTEDKYAIINPRYDEKAHGLTGRYESISRYFVLIDQHPWIQSSEYRVWTSQRCYLVTKQFALRRRCSS